MFFIKTFINYFVRFAEHWIKHQLSIIFIKINITSSVVFIIQFNIVSIVKEIYLNK